MAELHYCEKCNKMLDVKEFYKSKNVEKYPPDGKLHTCKKCLTMHVDNWDPETYKWILQEVDVPYIKKEWDSLLQTYLENHDPKKMTGVSILGKYLSKMKLKQWNKYHWEDTEKLAEEARQTQISQMKAQGFSGEEIEEKLAIDNGPSKPKVLSDQQEAVGVPVYQEEPDEFENQLTDEDKIRLRIKWGRGYRADEWVRLEQLYQDMEASYDIQGAGMKDTLIMICKASMKANQLIDGDDIEGFQKMTKVYNELMKSAKLTAAQNKAESGEFIDSIGELVALCEKEQFIPRYYTDGPMDKVDAVLKDLQYYTRTLVTEEMNLGNMIDASVKAIAQDKEREAKIAIDDDVDVDEEDTGYEYPDERELTDDDYVEFEEMKEQERQKDLERDD